jgi:hypothetical protein
MKKSSTNVIFYVFVKYKYSPNKWDFAGIWENYKDIYETLQYGVYKNPNKSKKAIFYILIEKRNNIFEPYTILDSKLIKI